MPQGGMVTHWISILCVVVPAAVFVICLVMFTLVVRRGFDLVEC
jgi:hypothetical protein